MCFTAAVDQTEEKRLLLEVCYMEMRSDEAALRTYLTRHIKGFGDNQKVQDDVPQEK